MKDKFRNFMIGRYGVDSLSKFMLGTAVVLLFLAMGFRNKYTCMSARPSLLFPNVFQKLSEEGRGESEVFRTEREGRCISETGKRVLGTAKDTPYLQVPVL